MMTSEFVVNWVYISKVPRWIDVPVTTLIDTDTIIPCVLLQSFRTS